MVMKLKLIPLLLPVALMLLVACGPTDLNDLTCEEIAIDYMELTKVDAPWIHKIMEIQEPSGRTDKSFGCLGSALLNTGRSRSVNFSASIDQDGVRWVGGDFVGSDAKTVLMYTDGNGNYGVRRSR